MGQITSQNPVTVAAETKSAYKIAYVIEAGELVKEGDVLVELDKSGVEAKIADQEIKVESQKAALATAQENYTIQELNNETNLNDALLNLELNGIALERYLGTPIDDEAVTELAAATPGDFEALEFSSFSAGDESTDPAEGLLHYFGPAGEAFQKIREAELVVKKADKELDWANRDLEGTQVLRSKEFATPQELEQAEFDVEQKKNALATAGLSRDLLKKYTLLQDVRKKVNDVIKARNNLKATKSKSSSQLTQKEVAVKEAQIKQERAIRQLEEYKEELAKMTIAAPSPGLVIIGEQRRHRYYSSSDDVKVGATAYPGRTLITLPDFSVMQASVKIHEVNINRIKDDQKALITLDAYPQVTFHGAVTKIAKLAEEESWYFGSEVKVFPVEITIEEEDERLKPGMTAKVEILVGDAEDVLYVPVDAVVEQEGAQISLVSAEGKLEPRQVVTGVSNADFVQIKEGLGEGELIALTPNIQEAAGVAESSGEKKPPDEMEAVKGSPKPGRGRSGPPGGAGGPR